MTDLFISYATEDRERARQLANALESQGWSVWWDRKIIPGQSYDQVIENALEAAKSVIVLWSKSSTTSEWVKNEAAVALERNVLVPSLIDDVRIPLEFRHKQAANLVSWNGEPSHEGYQALCNGIATIMTGVVQPQPTSVTPPGSRWNRRWTLSATAVLAVAIGLAYFTKDTWLPTITSEPIDTVESPLGTTSTTGPRDEIYRRLAIAQGRGLQMLMQRKPDALAHIDKSLKEADAATKTFPDDPRFHMLKGYILKDVYQSPISKDLLPVGQRREYLVRARQSAEEALRIDPRHAASHNLMGNILYFEGDCVAAIREFDTALKFNRDERFVPVIEQDKRLAIQKEEANACSGS